VNQFAQCLDRFRVPIKRENRANVNGHYPYFGANGEVSRIDEFIFDDELVLVTEDETFYGREKPIAYRSSGKCWVNNHAHVLRPKTKIGAEYLCYALMYYDVIPWLSGTTGRAKLTQQALNAIPIALPPDREMIEIVRRVQTLFAFADRLEARLTTARTAADRLTPALLAKAFRGELVPQDPEDEPAAALLARLAASRAADGGKAGRSGKSAKRKAS
jgi:type I restriction enzyme S subunit